MGFFLELHPAQGSRELRPLVGMWDSCGRGRVPCQEPGCTAFTAWPMEADGRRLCYFHSSFTAGTVGSSAAFDACMRHIESVDTDDECHVSVEYLRALFDHVSADADRIDALVEVGCFMGGLSAVLAHVAVQRGWPLYIIDVMLPNLAYTYHRLVRLYPEAAGLVRLYCGTFPEFVAEGRERLSGRRAFLSLDTIHTFDNAVRELTGSWHIRESLHSLAMHGFNYRSRSADDDLHADRALYAIFGLNARLEEIGSRFEGEDCPLGPDSPNQPYLKAGLGEGVLLRLDENRYCFDTGNPPPRRPEWALPGRSANPLPRLEFVFPEHSYDPWPEELLIAGGAAPRLGTLNALFQMRASDRTYQQIPSDAPLRIESGNPGIVRVDGTGLVGVEPGETEIRVSWGRHTRSIPARVIRLEAPAPGNGTDDTAGAPDPGAALRRIERSRRYGRRASASSLDPEALLLELEMLKASESYRFGKMVLAPLRRLKRLIRPRG